MHYFNMMKTIILTLFIVLTWFLTGCFGCNDWVENEIKPKYLYGKVVSLTHKPCFTLIEIEDKGIINKLEFCECGLNSYEWKTMKIGDFIQKLEGSTMVRLIQHDSTTIDFEYPCCDH